MCVCVFVRVDRMTTVFTVHTGVCLPSIIYSLQTYTGSVCTVSSAMSLNYFQSEPPCQNAGSSMSPRWATLDVCNSATRSMTISIYSDNACTLNKNTTTYVADDDCNSGSNGGKYKATCTLVKSNRNIDGEIALMHCRLAYRALLHLRTYVLTCLT